MSCFACRREEQAGSAWDSVRPKMGCLAPSADSGSFPDPHFLDMGYKIQDCCNNIGVGHFMSISCCFSSGSKVIMYARWLLQCIDLFQGLTIQALKPAQTLRFLLNKARLKHLVVEC